MVRWLMASRKDGRWGNTQENALAMESLVAYYRKYEAEIPSFDGRCHARDRTISRASSSAAASTDLDRPGACRCRQLLGKVPAGSSAAADLRARRERERSSTPLASATRPTSCSRTGSTAGVRIQRSYAPYVEKGTRPAATSYKAGDLVRVTLTFKLTKERRFLAVTDPLPAGFEPVESWFATTAATLGAAQDDQGTDVNDWTAWWQRGGFDHVERHDDRVQLFATRLSEGRHEFSYVVRATTAGHVPDSAGTRGGDVRAGGLRAHGDGGARGEEVALMPRLADRVRALRRHPRLAAAAVAFAAGVGVLSWIRLGPIAPELLDISDASSTMVVDRHGVPLYEALSGDGTRSLRLAPTTCRATLAAATVAAEDRRFYSHVGHRSDRHSARREARHRRAPVRGGWVDDHAADGEAAARTAAAAAGARRGREAAGGRARSAARAPVQQAGNSRAVPEPGCLRRTDRRRRKGQLRLFRPRRVDADAGAGGIPGRAAAAALRIQSVQERRRQPSRGSAKCCAGCRRTGIDRGRPGARGGGGAARVQAGGGAVCCPPLRRARAGRAPAARAGHASRRRSTPVCRRTSPASSAASVRCSIAMAPTTLPWSCSTTRTAEWLAWEGSGRLLRHRARRGDRRRGVAPAAGLGAEAVHVCAGDSSRGVTPATVLADIPSHFPTAEPGVLYSAAQLRRPLSWPAAGACARWPGRRTCRRWRSHRSWASRPSSAS